VLQRCISDGATTIPVFPAATGGELKPTWIVDGLPLTEVPTPFYPGATVLARAPEVVIVDPRDAAESVGLRYVSVEQPGIRRRKSGRGFRYVNPDGTSVTEALVLRGIRAIVIPPAWTEVWVCRFANGHIRATGRDAKGRKQYRSAKSATAASMST
jgi:hypothetical protein